MLLNNKCQLQLVDPGSFGHSLCCLWRGFYTRNLVQLQVMRHRNMTYLKTESVVALPIICYFILFFAKSKPFHIIHWLVMSLCVSVGGRGSLMGHATSFLAISPSFIDWFVCRMEVMLWSVRTSRPEPRARSPEQTPWSVLWQPQLFFWWVISCLPLIPWCVCVCICASEISCYFPSPPVTPKHCRENGSFFSIQQKVYLSSPVTKSAVWIMS